MPITTDAPEKEMTIDELIESILGISADGIEDLEPQVTSLSVDPDRLRAFMGSCHCSLSSPHV